MSVNRSSWGSWKEREYTINSRGTLIYFVPDTSQCEEKGRMVCEDVSWHHSTTSLLLLVVTIHHPHHPHQHHPLCVGHIISGGQAGECRQCEAVRLLKGEDFCERHQRWRWRMYRLERVQPRGRKDHGAGVRDRGRDEAVLHLSVQGRKDQQQCASIRLLDAVGRCSALPSLHSQR